MASRSVLQKTIFTHFLLRIYSTPGWKKKRKRKGKTVIKCTPEIFNSRVVFILLSTSVKLKKKKSHYFIFALFYITMDKKLFPVNFVIKVYFAFLLSVWTEISISLHDNKLLLQKLVVPNKSQWNIFPNNLITRFSSFSWKHILLKKHRKS